LVTGPPGEEIFTDKYGRVKVQFYWDREGKKDANSSCWLRVCTLWAGKEWGSINIPRIGQEVLVAFVEGNPDEPVIVGSVYNRDTMPANALPDKKVVCGLKSNTHKGKGYNEMSMDDTAGKWTMTSESRPTCRMRGTGWRGANR
jgi:type VI secretion system secreted protein VgrG